MKFTCGSKPEFNYPPSPEEIHRREVGRIDLTDMRTCEIKELLESACTNLKIHFEEKGSKVIMIIER